jgi:hypothetical protein
MGPLPVPVMPRSWPLMTKLQRQVKTPSTPSAWKWCSCIGRLAQDVFLPEHVLQLRAADLAAELVDDVVGDGAELALHVLRQFDAEFAFEQVGDAAFAALRVHADDLAVFAADVVRVDGEVGHVPDGFVLLVTSEAFLDGVLMAAAEGGEDEFAA